MNFLITGNAGKFDRETVKQAALERLGIQSQPGDRRSVAN